MGNGLTTPPGNHQDSVPPCWHQAGGATTPSRRDLTAAQTALLAFFPHEPYGYAVMPGQTRLDTPVKDGLDGWNLRRLVWVADRGFASAANRAYLTRGGGHYIHAEKLRHTSTQAAAALARQGRYHTAAGNLRVKEAWVPQGGDGARAQRFVICHNPEAAERDAAVRERLVTHLQGLIDRSDAWPAGKRDELTGQLRDKPGLRRFLRRTKTGLLRIDHTAIAREAHLDGKWLLRTSGLTLTPGDLAAAYKQLIAVETSKPQCCHSRGSSALSSAPSRSVFMNAA